MTKEEKQLLIKDLCARLPYGVKVKTYWKDCLSEVCIDVLTTRNIDDIRNPNRGNFEVLPYLRSIESMTDEEKKEFIKVLIKSQDCGYYSHNESATTMVNDWYLSKGFDVRGLIPMGLALEATEDMYK